MAVAQFESDQFLEAAQRHSGRRSRTRNLGAKDATVAPRFRIALRASGMTETWSIDTSRHFMQSVLFKLKRQQADRADRADLDLFRKRCYLFRVKYNLLKAHLAGQSADRVAMSFAEVAAAAKVKLPASAYRYAQWWENDAVHHVQAKAWIEAGYRTEQVDLAGQKLVFARTRERGVREMKEEFAHQAERGVCQFPAVRLHERDVHDRARLRSHTASPRSRGMGRVGCVSRP